MSGQQKWLKVVANVVLWYEVERINNGVVCYQRHFER